MTLVFGVWYFKILDFQETKYSLSLKQTLYFQHILKHKWSAYLYLCKNIVAPFTRMSTIRFRKIAPREACPSSN